MISAFILTHQFYLINIMHVFRVHGNSQTKTGIESSFTETCPQAG